MTHADQIEEFLKRNCTRMDDHDAENCRKCAEMRDELLILAASSRNDTPKADWWIDAVLRHETEHYWQKPKMVESMVKIVCAVSREDLVAVLEEWARA